MIQSFDFRILKIFFGFKMKFFTTRVRFSNGFGSRFIFQQHGGAECRIAHPESAESAAAESAADRENLAHSICDFESTDAAKSNLQSLGVRNVGRIQLDPQNQISWFKSKTRSTALEGLENIDDRLAGVEGVRTVLFKGGVLYEIRSLAEDGLGNPESIDSRLENKKIQSLIFHTDGSLSYKDMQANNHKLPAPENTDLAAESAPAEGEAAPTAADSADSGSAAAVSAAAPSVSAPAAPTAGAEAATIAGETNERLDLSGVRIKVDKSEVVAGELITVSAENLPTGAQITDILNPEGMGGANIEMVPQSNQPLDTVYFRFREGANNVGTYDLIARVLQRSLPNNEKEIPFQIKLNELDPSDVSQVEFNDVQIDGNKISFVIDKLLPGQSVFAIAMTIGTKNILNIIDPSSFRMNGVNDWTNFENDGSVKIEFSFNENMPFGITQLWIPIVYENNGNRIKKPVSFHLDYRSPGEKLLYTQNESGNSIFDTATSLEEKESLLDSFGLGNFSVVDSAGEVKIIANTGDGISGLENIYPSFANIKGVQMLALEETPFKIIKMFSSQSENPVMEPDGPHFEGLESIDSRFSGKKVNYVSFDFRDGSLTQYRENGQERTIGAAD